MAIDVTPIFHDGTDPEATTTPCEPRVTLRCPACQHEYVHCHVANATIRAFVARAWRCTACSGVS